MSWSGLGVWLAAKGSFRILLFHSSTYDQLLDINVGPAVAQKLQSMHPVDAFQQWRLYTGPGAVVTTPY